MTTPFEFSEIQVNFILDGRGASPSSRARSSATSQRRATIKELNSILKDEGKKRGVIKTELTELRTKYGDERHLTVDTGEFDLRRPHRGRRGRRGAHEDEHIKTVAANAFPPAGSGRQGRAWQPPA